jgi:hypothetical protein
MELGNSSKLRRCVTLGYDRLDELPKTEGPIGYKADGASGVGGQRQRKQMCRAESQISEAEVRWVGSTDRRTEEQKLRTNSGFLELLRYSVIR